MTRAVLFDLDDTLFDHRRSARAALDAVHRTFAGSVAFEDLERHHAHYLEEMHLEVLAGRMSLDDARRERFRKVFAALGLPLDPADADRVAIAYREGYVSARRAIDGAAALLAALEARVKIGIVSNNLLDEQRGKLAFCALDRFVDELVVSEETGISKPDPEIFRIALERLEVAPEEAVMVGDSWPADIAGAAAAGIRPIWFNPRGLPKPPEPADVEELRSLRPTGAVADYLAGAGRLKPGT
jgi:putative hydrolase of the HAD superfamily